MKVRSWESLLISLTVLELWSFSLELTAKIWSVKFLLSNVLLLGRDVSIKFCAEIPELKLWLTGCTKSDRQNDVPWYSFFFQTASRVYYVKALVEKALIVEGDWRGNWTSSLKLRKCLNLHMPICVFNEPSHPDAKLLSEILPWISQRLVAHTKTLKNQKLRFKFLAVYFWRIKIAKKANRFDF